MNSLQILCGYGRKSIVALIIISALTLSVAAQKVAVPNEQGRMYGDPGFVGEPINLNVVNADIRDILNYITEQYGINFVIDKSVKAIPVTVNVSGVPWNVALDSILRSQELGVQVNGTILRVAEQKTLGDEQAVQQRIRESQLDTSPLYTEFIRLNYARASGTLGTAGGAASQFQGGQPAGEAAGGGNNNSSGGSDQGILGIVKRRLSRRGAIEVDGRSNTIIVTDVRENIDAVRQLVTLLDQPEPQVEIEARIVIATRNFSRDIGVQLAALSLGPFGRGASFATLPGSPPAGGSGGTGTQQTGFARGGIPTGIGLQPNNSLISSIPNTVIGLTTGLLGTAQISALITAGENNGQAKTIATPRVTTLNNRSATIESGSQIPVTTIQPGSIGAVVATTTYISVPLRLSVTPQITDVGTVILNVVAENNTAAPAAGGPPPISVQRMQTEVMVPDGGTTVVGGAVLDDERKSQDRTPGLSSIPILGNLFKRTGTSRNSNEILFFITPRIYRPDFQGNPTSGTVTNGTRSTTIIQPVPLGNPGTNSLTPNVMQPAQQPQNPFVTIQPNVQPATTATPSSIPPKR
ncbi:MAG: type IV pilus secretin PilQ [Acidobacteriota bacterium]|nr:type IV pilus secretin PilQ [Acidobacteriota bacterium]